MNYAQRLAPMRAQLGIPSPKAAKVTPPSSRPGQCERWTAQGKPDLITPMGVSTAHDWKGMTPAAIFQGETFVRTLADVGVFGNPAQVKRMQVVPGIMTMPEAMRAKLDERLRWIADWTREDEPGVAVPKIPREPSLLDPPCVYRGDEAGKVACKSCRGNVSVKVYHCSKHGKCNLGHTNLDAGRTCRQCSDRTTASSKTEVIPFASFKNRYADREGWIVGRGPTQFCGEELASVPGPVFFINDAVAWERHVTHPDSFFFAVEWPKFAAYAWRIKSIAMMGFLHDHPADGIARVMRYQHAFKSTRDEHNPVGPLWHLLDQSREKLAESRMLYQHGSTMLLAIHFAWFCGIERLNLVGCDCLPTTSRGGHPATSKDPKEAYNPALPCETDDHGGVSGGIHPTLRRRHDEVIRRLGMRANYLGTPTLGQAGI